MMKYPLLQCINLRKYYQRGISRVVTLGMKGMDMGNFNCMRANYLNNYFQVLPNLNTKQKQTKNYSLYFS